MREAVVPEHDRTKPHPIERWIEGRLPGYRFGFVLTLLLATYVFMAIGLSGGWVRVVTVTLQGLTLLAALRASQVSRRLFRIAAVVAAVALLASLVSLLFDSGNDGTGAFFALSVLMVAGAPIAIGRALWRRPTVDVHTVLGAVCIYVLVGMLFAFLYGAVGYLASAPFFVQTNDPSSADFLYFSFITLTTVGYGDYTAAGGLGRALASIEALLGQIYLVTVVATIVSGMAHLRAERARTASPTAEENPGDAT
jgi:hypothetical protein